MSDQKFLPLNVRFRMLNPADVKSPCLVYAGPIPGKPGHMTNMPCCLEIALIDPDDGKEKWYEVPFFMPAMPVIEVGTAIPPRQRN